MRPLWMLLCSVALVLPIVALARAPSYTPPGATDAMLRFSWRMDVTLRENCRTRTAAELEALPVHMRTPEECTPLPATYALITRVANAAPDTLYLVRGGVKGDRPLFVLEERTLQAGDHRVRITLQRSTATGVEVLASLDSTLTLREGEVQLVTLDGNGRMVVRSAPVHDR